jgi:hypothetical protein
MRMEHDYRRGGALAYLAARDVHRGKVTGRGEHTTGSAPFSRLAEHVMTSEPYASGPGRSLAPSPDPCAGKFIAL